MRMFAIVMAALLALMADSCPQKGEKRAPWGDRNWRGTGCAGDYTTCGERGRSCPAGSCVSKVASCCQGDKAEALAAAQPGRGGEGCCGDQCCGKCKGGAGD